MTHAPSAGPRRRRPAGIESLPSGVAQAFAPAHKSALGAAVGLTLALLVFAVTAFHVAIQPADAPPIELLSQYLYGYTVTWTGAAIGACWGGVVGFVGGWFLAFLRNVTLAVWLLVIRTKSQLSHPFLDHI